MLVAIYTPLGSFPRAGPILSSFMLITLFVIIDPIPMI